MILDKKEVKRLVIFLFYDNNDIVDNYIPAFFESLKVFLWQAVLCGERQTAR